MSLLRRAAELTAMSTYGDLNATTTRKYGLRCSEI